jgi:hypothetical protein
MIFTAMKITAAAASSPTPANIHSSDRAMIRPLSAIVPLLDTV